MLPDERAVLAAALKTLLLHPIGFGIELCADLWIDRLEDGRLRIGRTYGTAQLQGDATFDSPDDAVQAYLQLCVLHTQPASDA